MIRFFADIALVIVVSGMFLWIHNVGIARVKKEILDKFNEEFGRLKSGDTTVTTTTGSLPSARSTP